MFWKNIVGNYNSLEKRCNACRILYAKDVLVKEENQLICNTCKSFPAIVKDNIIVYKGFDQKTDFFDKRAINILGQMYSTYTYNTFIDDLNKFNLNNIDLLNKKVGITTKFWWEKYIGKIGKRIILAKVPIRNIRLTHKNNKLPKTTVGHAIHKKPQPMEVL